MNYKLSIPFLCLFTSSLVHAENWPQYRGPDGSGISEATDVPLKWSDDNIEWKTDLPGDGQSTPVIWGNKLFLTYALPADNDQVTRHIACYDKTNGKQLWSHQASLGGKEKTHKMNTYATASCATDGKHVAAFFGPGGLHVVDVDGKPLWHKDLGEFPGPFGNGASPVIIDGKLIQNADAEGTSFIVAYDPATGNQIWKTPRVDKPKGGWNTPRMIDLDSHKELIVNGEFGLRGYNPESGEELWFCEGYNGRGTPIPAWGKGLLVSLNGKPGDIYAVKPGGKGNVSESHRAWHSARGKGRDLSSPVLVGDFVFTVNMLGIANGYDLTSGKEQWTARIGGNHSSSPVVANGLIYQLNEEGETIVIKPGKELDVVARNALTATGEVFRANPTFNDGKVYLRSNSALYCVK